MQILLAEDDVETAEFVARGLGELGHNVLRAADGADALHYAMTEDCDLIVLDRMLPKLDGLAVLRRLRAAKIETPVLLLTALGRIEDRVEGLEAGADDYLIKPFAFSELAARLNALRRRRPFQETPTQILAGRLKMDLLTRQVWRDGQIVPLQPREFRLLEELMRNNDRVVTRTMLLERVWGFHFDPQTNIVETHISRLRAKLNRGGAPDAIETLRGVGYRVRDDA
ncbi:MAG: two-component system, OmpR family, response regulator [Sphingomonadales bacterium]|jgi:two-component system OmpR family response regulator|nr:two-component system, OmpR family, response regulator [Sphingomonadales bacterium]